MELIRAKNTTGTSDLEFSIDLVVNGNISYENGEFTIPETGLYGINIDFHKPQIPLSPQSCLVEVIKNQTETVLNAKQGASFQGDPIAISQDMHKVKTVPLNAGDKIKVNVTGAPVEIGGSITFVKQQ